MSTAVARTVMEATVNAYVDRINAGDAAGTIALFAPDAVIEDPIGSEPKAGDALTDWFADTVAYATQITPVAPIRGSHADEALLVFDVTFTPPGSPRLRIRSADAFRLRPDGLILSLRAFWGPEDLGPA
jgi:steroid delta-isomerase